jgi:hypothetical protein
MARAVLGMMSASITRITVRKQLAAMGCERFEIGILQQIGRMLIRTVSSPKHLREKVSEDEEFDDRERNSEKAGGAGNRCR